MGIISVIYREKGVLHTMMKEYDDIGIKEVRTNILWDGESFSSILFIKILKEKKKAEVDGRNVMEVYIDEDIRIPGICWYCIEPFSKGKKDMDFLHCLANINRERFRMGDEIQNAIDNNSNDRDEHEPIDWSELD